MARNLDVQEPDVETEVDEDVVFEAPPTVTRGGGGASAKYERKLNALRQNPNQWGRVVTTDPDKSNGIANYLKSGKASGVDDRFDFVSRNVDIDGDGETEGLVYGIFLEDEDLYEQKVNYQEIASERRRLIREAKNEGRDKPEESELPSLPPRNYMV